MLVNLSSALGSDALLGDASNSSSQGEPLEELSRVALCDRSSSILQPRLYHHHDDTRLSRFTPVRCPAGRSGATGVRAVGPGAIRRLGLEPPRGVVAPLIEGSDPAGIPSGITALPHHRFGGVGLAVSAGVALRFSGEGNGSDDAVAHPFLLVGDIP